MTLKEKTLYHQIHPAKLFIDIAGTIAAVYFLWQQQLVAGIVLSFVLPIFISMVMIRTMNFDKQKNSAFGKYLEKNMSVSIESVRLVGLIVMLASGWWHIAEGIAGGFLIILATWMNGFFAKKADVPSAKNKKRK